MLALLLILTVALRCWNVADVFVEGKTFFVDADCYSRMTRVQRVLEHPGTVIHRHEFENWPQGTQPHTTAPFDYLTAGLAAVLRVLTHETQAALDLAGAWISPLLGLITAGFLWIWAGRNGKGYRGALLFLFAVSPILVHGTVLGRPDHQSLLILCMAVALGAEEMLLEHASNGWAIIGGAAWGLGLWVSLYEPLILLVCTIILGIVLCGKTFFKRERLWEGVALALVLACAGFVDGWQVSMPEPVVQEYFLNWSRTIGELRHVNLPGLLQWSGWLLLPAPLMLIWLGWKKRERAAWFWLVVLAVVTALTWWQARWGYFLALVFVMALPFILNSVPKRWIAFVLFVISLWPITVAWDGKLDQKQQAVRSEQRMDNVALYTVAQQIKGSHRLPVLAPWWLSPALAYWSGQPCVAGSSHESLPGTVDASRFFVATNPAEAERILARRRVACVVVYDPERVNDVSVKILGEPLQGAITGKATSGNFLPAWKQLDQKMCAVLFYTPHQSPSFLKSIDADPNGAFRLFLFPGGLEQ